MAYTKQVEQQLASLWVNSTFGNLLCRFAIVNMWIVLICGAPPQNEQELQGPSTHSKERHVGHTSLGNTRRGKYGCHDQAVKVRNMVEYDDGPRSVSLCNVLPALHSQTEEVETKANAQRCPEPASSDSRSIGACTRDAKVTLVTTLQQWRPAICNNAVMRLTWLVAYLIHTLMIVRRHFGSGVLIGFPQTSRATTPHTSSTHGNPMMTLSMDQGKRINTFNHS